MSNYILKTEITINPLLVQIYQKINGLEFKGRFGLLVLPISPNVKTEIRSTTLILTSGYNNKLFLNLYTSLSKSYIKGVVQGFKTKIHLKGLGYKFGLDTNTLILKIGFSHDIIINIPKSIKLLLSKKSTHLTLIGSDYQKLTQFTHFIRQFKKPEPYKGKGIFLKNEEIKKKEGKKKNDSRIF